MRILDKNEVLKEQTIITIGNFDGLHLAHIDVLDFLRIKSQEMSLKSVVFTFENHPEFFFKKDNFRLLTTKIEKDSLFKNLNIDYVNYEYFDLELATLNVQEFVDKLQRRFNMKALVIGDDNKIGKDRQGDYESLKKIGEKSGFEVFKIKTFTFKNQRISSSIIRQLILNGNIESANELLGHKYFIFSQVISGKSIGRKLGFPTANLLIEQDKLLPKQGVYAVEVEILNKKYLGMCNIGYCPTVRTNEQLTIEVNIFNFIENIYFEQIKVLFLKRIRDEKHFPNIEQLTVQLQKDKEEILKDFKI